MNHKKILTTAGVLIFSVVFVMFIFGFELLEILIATFLILSIVLTDLYLVEFWFKYLTLRKQIKSMEVKI